MTEHNCLGDRIMVEWGSRILVLPYEHHGHGGLHSHVFHEFVYIERGFTLHTYNGVTTVLTPGDLFAIKPGDIHGYTSAYHTRLFNCLFMLETLGEEIESLKALPGLSVLLDEDEPSAWKRIHLDIAGRNEVLDYLGKMTWECINKPLGWELHLRSMLINFLVLYARAYSHRFHLDKGGADRYFKHVYNALRYIEEHYGEGISAGDVATATGLSVDYLSRQFKHLTGLTPMEYLKNYRFAKAVELLKDQDVTVAEVASAVGFDDPCYFTRLFKSIIGANPTEYRHMSEEASSRITYSPGSKRAKPGVCPSNPDFGIPRANS